MTQTRGERNNNPGNLNFIPRRGWRGQAGLEEPGPGVSPRFGRYDSASNGIRAIGKQLSSYFAHEGPMTLEQIAAKWAPASDGNDPKSYAVGLAQHSGLPLGTPLALHSPEALAPLVRAIIIQENSRCLWDLPSISLAIAS